jgi:hypothetical protein
MSKQISSISKILEMAIKRYQFDVVGWTKFCIDNKISVRKALPSDQSESLEMLRIQDKISKPLNTPPIKKIYDSKSEYIKWLDKEYVRDQAFYEAILKNPGKYKLNLENDLLNKEIDNSARKGLMLGASEEDIMNNFGLYFINLLKAHFTGSRTAFLSSSGPEYWHELDKCKAELTYFKEEIIRPSLDILKKKKIKK